MNKEEEIRISIPLNFDDYVKERAAELQMSINQSVINILAKAKDLNKKTLKKKKLLCP